MKNINEIFDYEKLKTLSKTNWEFISNIQTLSEDFIREFQDCVDWYWISKYQILSENFIREFRD